MTPPREEGPHQREQTRSQQDLAASEQDSRLPGSDRPHLQAENSPNEPTRRTFSFTEKNSEGLVQTTTNTRIETQYNEGQFLDAESEIILQGEENFIGLNMYSTAIENRVVFTSPDMILSKQQDTISNGPQPPYIPPVPLRPPVQQNEDSKVTPQPVGVTETQGVHTKPLEQPVSEAPVPEDPADPQRVGVRQTVSETQPEKVGVMAKLNLTMPQPLIDLATGIRSVKLEDLVKNADTAEYIVTYMKAVLEKIEKSPELQRNMLQKFSSAQLKEGLDVLNSGASQQDKALKLATLLHVVNGGKVTEGVPLSVNWRMVLGLLDKARVVGITNNVGPSTYKSQLAAENKFANQAAEFIMGGDVEALESLYSRNLNEQSNSPQTSRTNGGTQSQSVPQSEQVAAQMDMNKIISETVSVIKRALDDASSGVFGETGRYVQEALGETGGYLGGTINEIGSIVGESVGGTLSSISSSWGQGVDKLHQRLNQMDENREQRLGEIMNSPLEQFREYVNGVAYRQARTTAQALGGDLESMVWTVLDLVPTSKIGKVLDLAGDTLRNVGRAAEVAEDGASMARGVATEAAEETAQRAASSSPSIVERVTASAQEAWQNTRNAVNSAWTNISNTWNSFTSRFSPKPPEPPQTQPVQVQVQVQPVQPSQPGASNALESAFAREARLRALQQQQSSVRQSVGSR
jgi:hypothetical protein